MVYIDCKNVTLSYEGREVVSGLTFQIEKGDYLCIVGENGSGKSTLVKGILGFVKAHRSSTVRAFAAMKSATFRSRAADSAIFPPPYAKW